MSVGDDNRPALPHTDLSSGVVGSPAGTSGVASGLTAVADDARDRSSIDDMSIDDSSAATAVTNVGRITLAISAPPVQTREQQQQQQQQLNNSSKIYLVPWPWRLLSTCAAALRSDRRAPGCRARPTAAVAILRCLWIVLTPANGLAVCVAATRVWPVSRAATSERQESCACADCVCDMCACALDQPPSRWASTHCLRGVRGGDE